MPDETIRCPFDDALLDTPSRLAAGECGCRWQPGDIILNPATQRLLLGEYDPVARVVRWTELAPIGRYDQPNAPAGAVLVCRTFEGRRLPVTDLGTGDLYAVEAL